MIVVVERLWIAWFRWILVVPPPKTDRSLFTSLAGLFLGANFVHSLEKLVLVQSWYKIFKILFLFYKNRFLRFSGSGYFSERRVG